MMDDISMISVDENVSLNIGQHPSIAVDPPVGSNYGSTQGPEEVTDTLQGSHETSTKFKVDPSSQDSLLVERSGRRTYNIDKRLPLASEGVSRTSTGSSDRSLTPTPEPRQDQFGKPLEANCSEGLSVSTGVNGKLELNTKCVVGAFAETLNAVKVKQTSGGKYVDVESLTEGVREASSVAANDRRTFNKSTSSPLDRLSPPGTRIKPAACEDDDNDEGSTPTKLNGTFSKTPSSSPPLNRTFDKESSALLCVDNNSTRSKTPELDLRLDFTVPIEESHAEPNEPCRVNVVTKDDNPASPDTLGTPEMHEPAGRNQSTPRAVRGKLVSTPGVDLAEIGGDRPAGHEGREPEETNSASQAESTLQPEVKRRVSDPLLKRRSGNLELSFVSSPKRANCQKNTPGGGGRDLINLHESLAFDFSAAAATAQANNGMAEMGSFVFSTSSGRLVPPDVFDLSALEKINAGNKTKRDHKYTRVSFIAMFDPIKPGTPVRNYDGSSKPAPHNEDEENPSVNVSTRSHRASAAPCLHTVAVQTEPLPENLSTTRRESASPSDTIDYDEISGRIKDLNAVVESQRLALSTYVKVTSLLRSRMAVRQDGQENGSTEKQVQIKVTNPDQGAEVARLKESLAFELDRNRQQDEVIRNLERSMHLTLRRMAECRESNAALAKVVEEQLSEMAATRAHCEAKELNMTETLAREEEEKRALQEKCQADERSYNKAMALIRLQLQAKESELESTDSQLVIAKKEIESLRKLVTQMNLQ